MRGSKRRARDDFQPTRHCERSEAIQKPTQELDCFVAYAPRNDDKSLVSAKMIIAQISDTHVALDAPDADRRMQDFASTIADINALDPAPDVIVHTGDIVHNGRPDEYAQAAAVLAMARAPLYVLPGNKDERTNLRAAFSAADYSAPGHTFIDYAVEDYPVRLIALDTLCPGHGRGDFRREQAEHLAALIDAEPNKPIAVFTHHPPFEVTVGPDRFHFTTMEGMARLRETLARCSRIVAVFSGHVHRAASGQVGRIPASVVPCIATTLRKGDYPPAMKTRPVYYLHRFDPAWGFVTESRVVAEGTVVRDRAPAPIAAVPLAGQ
jgi:3',5'-cyclic AMP phosphodiesterase CpdA